MNQGRMPKRKAEGPPVINAEPEVDDPEPSRVEGVLTAEQELTPNPPTGEECQRELAEGHLSSIPTEVEKRPVPEYSSFWALLSLAGYETW